MELTRRKPAAPESRPVPEEEKNERKPKMEKGYSILFLTLGLLISLVSNVMNYSRHEYSTEG